MTKIIKYWFYFLLTLPALLFLLLPTLLGDLGSKPWKKLLIHSGFCTLSLFVLCLLLAPLAKHFPRIKLLKTLNRHRRAIGITVFLYASFHLSCALIKTILKKGTLPSDYFLHPVIFPAFLAFLILFALAITSNNWSIRSLTSKKWKSLHRMVYAAELLLFLHVLLQTPLYAFAFFIPLFLAQAIRLR